MKWIALISSLLMSGCCLTPAIFCCERASATLVEPVMVYPYYSPVDITTTTIDYYQGKPVYRNPKIYMEK